VPMARLRSPGDPMRCGSYDPVCPGRAYACVESQMLLPHTSPECQNTFHQPGRTCRPDSLLTVATEATIERWDHVLDEVEKTRKGSPFINLLVPGYKQFDQGFRLTVNVITRAFRDAWQTDRPADGSALFEVLEPVAAVIDDWDFTQPAEPQVDKFMGVVAEARRRLAEDDLSESTAEEVVADLETLLKVSVLVARVGHQGALAIADAERQGRTQSANRATDRPPTYLDLNTMRWGDQPSKTTLPLSVFMSMVTPRMATFAEAIKQPVEDQPEIMKRFAAQWVVHVYTEWEEHYRPALAAALGCGVEAVGSDYFADLKRMRQDYVHKMRGIARNSAKNQLLRWYAKGDSMIPTHANYEQLLADFPREELMQPKPVPPAQRKPIPANATPDLVRKFQETADRLGIGKDEAVDQMLSAWIAANPDTDANDNSA
jgi:hypothetical protein